MNAPDFSLIASSLNMTPGLRGRVVLLSLVLAALPLAGRADKPDWAGDGPGQGRGQGHGHPRTHQAPAPQAGIGAPQVQIRIGSYFDVQQRRVVHEDLQRMIRAGHCPPGTGPQG